MPPKADSPSRPLPRRHRSGFTLFEVLVSLTLSCIVLAAVVTTFLHLGRSGMGLQNYTEMETEARMTLQRFGRDCRQATDASWTNSATLQLTVDGAVVTYLYNAGTGTFARSENGASTVLADDITTLAFRAYDINATELDVAGSPATAGGAAKMIQVDLSLAKTIQATPTTTQRVVSARYVLRNKKVS